MLFAGKLITRQHASHLNGFAPMHFPIRSIVVAILGIINLAIVAPGKEAAAITKRAGEFANTCGFSTINGWTLEAQCQYQFDDSTFAQISTLDLRKCLANSGGHMVCRPSE
jgi:hypothetical protein